MGLEPLGRSRSGISALGDRSALPALAICGFSTRRCNGVPPIMNVPTVKCIMHLPDFSELICGLALSSPAVVSCAHWH